MIDAFLMKDSQNTDSRKVFIKELGFDLLDFNHDSAICEYDLYNAVKNSNDKLYTQALA